MRLPSERKLSEKFNVTRTTLRQALSTLCEEGILERRAGSGTYVVGERVREMMRGTTSFTEIITSQGKTPSSKIVSYTKVLANKVEREKLGIVSGSEVIKMERVRYADETPICLEITCIPFNIIKGFKKEDITHHFFATLQSSGKIIGRSEKTIAAKNTNQEIADYLNIKPASAILSVTQVSYFSDGEAFEYVLSYYAGDRFEFYLER
ncbi:GntR family transcriptional regulator [Lactovum miscens]|uniref:GntR family transcriptional regulator n=2 Tax=Lactovum miscens TaxID=190387 RepID=A0A841C449_9LACT|nr:GntR family transcriptional regulator [Lactovum miscens]